MSENFSALCRNFSIGCRIYILRVQKKHWTAMVFLWRTYNVIISGKRAKFGLFGKIYPRGCQTSLQRVHRNFLREYRDWLKKNYRIIFLIMDIGWKKIGFFSVNIIGNFFKNENFGSEKDCQVNCKCQKITKKLLVDWMKTKIHHKLQNRNIKTSSYHRQIVGRLILLKRLFRKMNSHISGRNLRDVFEIFEFQ